MTGTTLELTEPGADAEAVGAAVVKAARCSEVTADWVSRATTR